MIRQIVETSTPSLSDPHKFIHSLIHTTMAAIATKFALWEVPTLDTLKDTRAYILREKVNNRETLSREEKNWISYQVNLKSGLPVRGWRFDFSDILKTFLVNQYGCWHEYKSVDKTALRKFIHGRINKIVQI